MIILWRKRSVCLLGVLFMVAGCGLFKKPEPTIAPFISATEVVVEVNAHDLQYVECPYEENYEVPPEALENIRCAKLTVPEDWNHPDGAKIKVAVAIVKTRSSEPKPDPVLVFIGNPGYGIFIAYALPYFLDNIYTQRDLIIVDQRGSGFSEPSVECPELAATGMSNANLSIQESSDQLVEAARSCYMKAREAGINFSAYTTSAEAADLDYLRQVMGIKQWNIFSLMTGSRLALTMMRDYPHTIRSVVLDSPIPLQANPAVEWGTNVEKILGRFFKLCAADTQCAEHYPDLEDAFYTLLDKLETEPMVFTVSNQYSGQRSEVTLTNERLITYLVSLFITVNERDTVGEVPRMIYQLRDGKTEVAKDMMARVPANDFATSAMDMWLDCNEENSFITLEQVKQANGALNQNLRDYFNAQAEGTLRACEEWKTPGVSEIENLPVNSSIPTLLFAGELDWSAPPEWADLIASSLPNSTAVGFALNGPIIYGSQRWTGCTHQLLDAFLENPEAELDVSCASAPVKITWITLP